MGKKSGRRYLQQTQAKMNSYSDIKTIPRLLCGLVVKNPPANAGDTGLIPGPGRSHMPQSN